MIGPLAHIQPPSPSHRFLDGQKYVYTGEWRIWTAGSATVRLDDMGDAQHVTATADSTGVVSLLYRVHDRFESWFDQRSFCSQQILKNSEEGLHKRNTTISFDRRRQKAVLDEANLRTGERKHTEQDTPGCVTDVLSGIFYVGSLPLVKGNTYVFPVSDGKTVDARATVEDREPLKTDAGTFNTVRVVVDVPAGVTKEPGRLWLWYSDDSQRIPVQMRARLFWGTITFRLTGNENK